MQNAQIIKLVKDKVFLIDSFLLTSSLNPSAESERVLRHAVTGIFLNSVVMELIVKIYYELDHKKLAPFSHNVLNLFNQLKSKTRNDLVEAYNEARDRKYKAFENIEGDFTFPPIEDVLKENEKIIKNFKYSPTAGTSNSSVDGAFYEKIMNDIKERAKELGV